mgnify:CR=1 FL=1
MPKSNHSSKKKPGRAQWYRRRNLDRERKRREHANYLAFLANHRKGQL